MVRKLTNNARDAEKGVDVRAVVQFFGGRQALVLDLIKYEIVQLDVTAIDKWQQRGIPAARRADLVQLARLKKLKFKFSNFTARPIPKKKAA